MAVSTKLRSNKCIAFGRDEDGSASIESLFWIPIFVFMLVLILDTSFIFFGKSQALRAVQDGNRALSVGAIADEDAAEEFIVAAMVDHAPGITVETLIEDGIIVSTATMPAKELMIVGSIPVFKDTVISVTAKHFLEQ
jgi:hypothetical protein